MTSICFRNVFVNPVDIIGMIVYDGSGDEQMDSDWNLKGCRRDDPSRFRTPEDVVERIHEVGFLSLFATEIPGFSVEEHTYAWDWWCDDPKRDPWVWRMEIAAREDIAYGKFFDRKAGFVSLAWFPVFANYRRDGYDYEGMYEDGKLNGRAKKILDALELDENAVGLELMSGELRHRAALEKGFDNVLISLQMQSFLLISGFRQKRNKKGIAYGWHLPSFMTPETKWGYDTVNSISETTEASGSRMTEQIRKHYPDAGEKEIRKVMGI